MVARAPFGVSDEGHGKGGRRVTVRSCQQCKFYEPAAVWRRGWCRNPKLYGPHDSRLVDEASLDCARGLGSFWEPRDGRRPPRFQPRRPFLMLSPAPQLALAGAMMASAAGGGAASGGGARGTPPLRPEQERPVSFEPEERYWTDYLRIALPVLGLLLLVGLLWYWASALIGGPTDQPPPSPTTIAVVEPINPATPPPAPTPTPAPVVPTPGPPPPTAPAVAVAPTVAPTPPPAPTEAAAAPAANADNPCANLPVYDPGSVVVTTEAVNLRDGPSTDSNILRELPANTRLTIAGDFSEAGTCDWWPVTVVDTGEAGYVIEQYLRAEG